MTYKNLIDNLTECSLVEPNVRTVICPDIYELNSLSDVEYNVVCITPNTFQVSEDVIVWSLNIYYVDRWDSEHQNQIDIQSAGITALNNIINRFSESLDIEITRPITFIPFYQKFTDVCAGIYCTVQITTDSQGLCVDYE